MKSWDNVEHINQSYMLKDLGEITKDNLKWNKKSRSKMIVDVTWIEGKSK